MVLAFGTNVVHSILYSYYSRIADIIQIVMERKILLLYIHMCIQNFSVPDIR